MQRHTQAENITTNLKVREYFTLTAFSVKNDVTWKCHVDDSNKGVYDMILGRYLLTELGLKLKFSEHVIESGNGIFKGSTTPMVYFGMYIFKGLSKDKITPE